jgi:hypothetical protein
MKRRGVVYFLRSGAATSGVCCDDAVSGGVTGAEHDMTKGDFRKLFLKALNAAADNAEARLAIPVPRSFKIELHAPRSTGTAMGVDEALDQIWLGNSRFYRIIDVAIKEALPGNRWRLCASADTRQPALGSVRISVCEACSVSPTTG